MEAVASNQWEKKRKKKKKTTQAVKTLPTLIKEKRIPRELMGTGNNLQQGKTGDKFGASLGNFEISTPPGGVLPDLLLTQLGVRANWTFKRRGLRVAQKSEVTGSTLLQNLLVRIFLVSNCAPSDD
eukprot:235370-Pelagomonas_calceolata.AAC.1